MKFIRNILFKTPQKEGDFFCKIEKIIKYTPHNINIFRTAFTHRTLNLKDKEGNPLNYERLEYLGDAVLGTIIASYLFKEAPYGDEGYLTKMRSKIVSREHLNQIGSELQLIDLLETNIPADNIGKNINGNLFESIIGAIYLDKGFNGCITFVENVLINPYVDIEKLENKVISYKSLLIEWCQKEKKEFLYKVYEDSGNNQELYFSVKLIIDKKTVSKGRALSKKKAEEVASKRAFFAFQKEITEMMSK